MQLNQRHVLITGGSRGLGRALAFAFGARGARVSLVARDAAALAETVAALEGRGVTAHGIVADLLAPDAPARIAGEAAGAHGDIDVLVHNASRLGPTPLLPLLELEPEEVAEVFRVNVLAPFALGRAVLGSMSLRGDGVVVSVSSDAAVEAYPTWGAYGASKAAQDHLHRVWATELEEAGVRVHVVDPGEMDTAMHAAALPEADPATLRDPADVAAGIVRLVADPAPAQGVRSHIEVAS